jgi:hypothetical protein
MSKIDLLNLPVVYVPSTGSFAALVRGHDKVNGAKWNTAIVALDHNGGLAIMDDPGTVPVNGDVRLTASGDLVIDGQIVGSSMTPMGFRLDDNVTSEGVDISALGFLDAPNRESISFDFWFDSENFETGDIVTTSAGNSVVVNEIDGVFFTVDGLVARTKVHDQRSVDGLTKTALDYLVKQGRVGDEDGFRSKVPFGQTQRNPPEVPDREDGFGSRSSCRR